MQNNTLLPIQTWQQEHIHPKRWEKYNQGFGIYANTDISSTHHKSERTKTANTKLRPKRIPKTKRRRRNQLANILPPRKNTNRIYKKIQKPRQRNKTKTKHKKQQILPTNTTGNPNNTKKQKNTPMETIQTQNTYKNKHNTRRTTILQTQKNRKNNNHNNNKTRKNWDTRRHHRKRKNNRTHEYKLETKHRK